MRQRDVLLVGQNMLLAQPFAHWVHGCPHSALWAWRGFVQPGTVQTPTCGPRRTGHVGIETGLGGIIPVGRVPRSAPAQTSWAC